MIMPRGQQLLMPVNPLFIWASLLLAMVLNMVPLGRVAWTPDLLMLLLVFWSVHQPSRVGMGAAFVFGLCMDVHQAALLGQHALAYTALTYVAITFHRRLLWLTLPAQAVQVLPWFFAAHVIELVLRLMAGGIFPGWSFLLAPLLEALLWPVASFVLLAPQRRAPDPDKIRPL